MTAGDPLPAFAGYGIELEYMIVDRASLAIRPVACELLRLLAEAPPGCVERGDLGWSNELVAHVVELKNVRPTPVLGSLCPLFQAQVDDVDRRLATLSATLMPGGMHPFMDPRDETTLWRHDNAALYEAFDSIFDCRRHGWANLQSMHINLPFADDVQFERLHAAIRVVLPVIPALAASSPIADSERKRTLDYRLEVYRTNSDRCPAIAGDVIPGTVRSPADYQQCVLTPMYRQIAPLDPTGLLQHEWLNAHGAIARFERNAIEIRLADTQECPRADLAVAAAVVAAVRAMYEEQWSSLAQQQAIKTRTLAAILRACIADAEDACIADAAFLRLFGASRSARSAGALWRQLLDSGAPEHAAVPAWSEPPLQMIAAQGTLARRVLRAIGEPCSPARIRAVYGRLCECLAHGTLFSVT